MEGFWNATAQFNRNDAMGSGTLVQFVGDFDDRPGVVGLRREGRRKLGYNPPKAYEG